MYCQCTAGALPCTAVDNVWASASNKLIVIAVAHLALLIIHWLVRFDMGLLRACMGLHGHSLVTADAACPQQLVSVHEVALEYARFPSPSPLCSCSSCGRGCHAWLPGPCQQCWCSPNPRFSCGCLRCRQQHRWGFAIYSSLVSPSLRHETEHHRMEQDCVMLLHGPRGMRDEGLTSTTHTTASPTPCRPQRPCWPPRAVLARWC